MRNSPSNNDLPDVSKEVIQRENAVIALLINGKVTDEIVRNISVNEFKYDLNKKIAEKLYDEYKKGNSNISNSLDLFEDEKIINHLSGIMTEDIDDEDITKTTKDIINMYKKEKMIEEKNYIIKRLEDKQLDKQEQEELESRLSSIIIEIARMK